MAIPSDCIKVTFVFDLYGAGGQKIEQGAFGFHGQRVHFNTNSVDWPADIQALAVAMRTKWVDHAIKSQYSPAVVMNRVDTYHLSTANKTLDKGSAPWSEIDEWDGSAAAGAPWELSCVASLYGYTPGAFAQDARNKRGRFYLPTPGLAGLDQLTGTLSTATQAAVLGFAEAWLNDVQGTHMGTTTPSNPDDYFNLGILSVTKQAFYPANYVRIGRVLDVQNRRRKNQDEAYTSAAIEHS